MFIYKSADGKVIVEDMLLNFIAVKMRTLADDEIVLLASNNFSSELIEESKQLLLEMCMTSISCIKHKGFQKDTNNINTYRFVSHCLDELPSVGFGNMEVGATHPSGTAEPGSFWFDRGHGSSDQRERELGGSYSVNGLPGDGY